jgi:hypothetical protein
VDHPHRLAEAATTMSIQNKATNANGGLKWIQKGGGYYSECNKQLKG